MSPSDAITLIVCGRDVAIALHRDSQGFVAAGDSAPEGQERPVVVALPHSREPRLLPA
jgi:hypothetical protein